MLMVLWTGGNFPLTFSLKTTVQPGIHLYTPQHSCPSHTVQPCSPVCLVMQFTWRRGVHIIWDPYRAGGFNRPTATQSYDYQHFKPASQRSSERALCHYWERWHLPLLASQGATLQFCQMVKCIIAAAVACVQEPPKTELSCTFNSTQAAPPKASSSSTFGHKTLHLSTTTKPLSC